ncbi:MAG: glycosyltransferase family 39 protein [bacterium]
MKILNSELKDFLKNNKILLIILLLSFCASLFYSFHFKIKPLVDARAYDKIAFNIVSGQGYREDLDKDLAHDYAIARVGPLYQYFLAGAYKIFGHDLRPVWILQAVVHALSAWLVYLTVLLIFFNSERKKTIGLWASAIFGFYPDLIEISAMLMSETLYLFLLCLMLYFFFWHFRQKSYWLVACLALASGLAVLARPTVLLFTPVIIFYFYRGKLWRQGILFLIILAAVFTPWTVRNYAVYQEFMPFGAAGNFNFWIGNYHNGNGEQEPTDEQRQFAATEEVKNINGESLARFKEFLRDYPAEFLKLTIFRISKYFSVARPMGFWFYQTGLGQMLFVLSSALASCFLFVLGLGGIIKSVFFKKETQREALAYLAVFALSVSLLVFVTVVETRYRFQIYPALAIFAAYFLVALGRIKTWAYNKILWAAIGLIFLNGLVDLLLNLERFKEKIGLF